jgi:hypothetical protein
VSQSIQETHLVAEPSVSGPIGWARLLQDEERHCARQGFGAGVIVVSFTAELLSRVDEDSRALVESAIVALIERHLRWTDRGMTLATGRFGVVTVPVDGAAALAARARGLHAELTGRGLIADVAYALRRDRGGLLAAAARADAALDTAAARRRTAIDL